MNPIRIGIYDDHPFIIEGIKTAVNQTNNAIEVVFEANEKEDLYQKIEMFLPDILVLDIVTDEVVGLENFQKITFNFPEVNIIAFSSLSNPVLVENLLAVGVKGFVNKKQKISDLLQTIYKVFDRKIAVSEEYQFLISVLNPIKAVLLTNREIEIVNLIGNEFTTFQISEKIFITQNTVESHRKRIFQKLNVKNVAGMILEAARLGYIKT